MLYLMLCHVNCRIQASISYQHYYLSSSSHPDDVDCDSVIYIFDCSLATRPEQNVSWCGGVGVSTCQYFAICENPQEKNLANSRKLLKILVNFVLF